MINKIKKRPVKTGPQIDYSMTLQLFYCMAIQEESQIIVLADHIGNTGLRILASPFSIYSMGVR